MKNLEVHVITTFLASLKEEFLANGSDSTKPNILVVWLYERAFNIVYYVYTKKEEKEGKIKTYMYL